MGVEVLCVGSGSIMSWYWKEYGLVVVRARFCLVLFGLLWFGMVWFELIRFGLVWFGSCPVLFCLVHAKHPTPNTKHQTLNNNTKHQTPNTKHQTPNTKPQMYMGTLVQLSSPGN